MNRIIALLLLCPALLGAQTRYASETLKLRAGASERSRVLSTITAGAAVDVRDCDRAGGEWCLVVVGAQRGFVEARLLDAERTSGGLPSLSTNALVSPQGDASTRSPTSAPPCRPRRARATALPPRRPAWARRRAARA